MNADADTIASLEHVQSLQTLLLRAILAELPPPARARALARFTAAAERLPVADDDADAAGAAFCAEGLARLTIWRTCAGWSGLALVAWWRRHGGRSSPERSYTSTYTDRTKHNGLAPCER